MTITDNPTPNYGDRRISYTIDPYNLSGRTINNGWAYSNAWTLEDARETAHRKVAGDVNQTPCAYATIHGFEVEFSGGGWRELHQVHYERIDRTAPVAMCPEDYLKRCYETTAGDYHQTMHEPRSDGSCQCGATPGRFPGFALTPETGVNDHDGEPLSAGDMVIVYTAKGWPGYRATITGRSQAGRVGMILHTRSTATPDRLITWGGDVFKLDPPASPSATQS